MVIDQFQKDWSEKWPGTTPDNQPWVFPKDPRVEKLEKDVEEMKKQFESLIKLLKAAKIYDEESGQPDCEMDEKVALIKRLSELLEVDVSDIFAE